MSMSFKISVDGDLECNTTWIFIEIVCFLLVLKLGVLKQEAQGDCPMPSVRPTVHH